MKKLRFSLGLLVLIFIMSSLKISAVNTVPFGDITGKKTEPTTTESSSTEPTTVETTPKVTTSESTTTEPESTETNPSESANDVPRKRRDGVKIVPFGEITGKKTEPTTTDPGSNETEPSSDPKERTSGVRILITPPLFSYGRVEDIFPVSYKVPEQWLGEFMYDEYNDPTIFYYPRINNFDTAVQVLAYEVNREDLTDEEFLRYIMDTIKEENEYTALQYKLVQGPDFPYARLTIERDYKDSNTYLDRFYRMLGDQVIMFQSLVFDAPNAANVKNAEAMFLSQFVDDATLQIPSSWKSVTQEKAVYRYPETWNFNEMIETENTLGGLVHKSDDGLTFFSTTEEYDSSPLEENSDYYNALEHHAQNIAASYDEYIIAGIDVYLDTEYTIRMRLFSTLDGEKIEVQVFSLLDTFDNRLYTLLLETESDHETPDWEAIELFDTIVESFEVNFDPTVGQA